MLLLRGLCRRLAPLVVQAEALGGLHQVEDGDCVVAVSAAEAAVLAQTAIYNKESHPGANKRLIAHSETDSNNKISHTVGHVRQRRRRC